MLMTDQEVLDSKDDLEMMRRPHLWPHQIMLPLKHRTERSPDGGRRLAILFHDDDDFGLLEDVNMLELQVEDWDRINWADTNILEEISLDWRVD